MLVFAEQRFVDAYNERGEYPKIHDAITQAVKEHAPIKGAIAIDLGACTGLLSARLVKQLGASHVISLEPNESYRERAVKLGAAQQTWLPIKLATPADLARLASIIKLRKAAAPAAPVVGVFRRVLSEVGSSGGVAFVTELGKMLAERGVGTIVLEGRVPVKNPTTALWNGELEARALADSNKYAIDWRSKNGSVIVLKMQ